MRIFLLPKAVLFCYNICGAVLETAQYGKGNDIIMLKVIRNTLHTSKC